MRSIIKQIIHISSPIFITLFLHACMDHAGAGKNPSQIKAPPGTDSVYLISRLAPGTHLSFYNMGQISLQEWPYLLSSEQDSTGSKISLQASEPVFLYEFNSGIPFMLRPGEKIFVSVDKQGLPSIHSSHDGIRDHELNFFTWLIHSGGHIPLVAGRRHGYHIAQAPLNKVAKQSELIRYQLISEQEYVKNIALLKKYAAKYKVNDDFINYAKKYFLYGKYLPLLRVISSGQAISIENLSDTLSGMLTEARKLLLSDTSKPTPVMYIDEACYTNFITQGSASPNRRFYALYDTIRSMFTGASQQLQLFMLLQKYMDKNITNYSAYLNQFCRNCRDADYIEFLKDNYSVYQYTENLSSDSGVNSTPLTDTSGKLITWGSLLKKYNKKIILVDLWASWCDPCRREIPFSIRLAKKYKDKNVAFIFLSTDKFKTKWKESINDLHLYDQINYKLANPYRKLLVQEYNIQSIPHYILIGYHGNLISRTAPLPSSPDLEKMLKKALKN